MKRFLAAAATTALLATGGVAVAGAAQDSSGGTTTSAPAATNTPSAQGRARVAVRFVALAGRTAAKTIGITPAELRREVKGGKTIADVATAHHVDPKTVENDITTAANAAIAKALSNGKIDTTQAAALKAAIAKRVPNFVEHTPHLKGAAKLGARVRATEVGALGLAAKTIGVTRQDLATALRSGQTIADVAKAHNVDPQTVIDAIVKAGSQRLTAAAQKFVDNPHVPKQPAPAASTAPTTTS